MGFGKVIDEDNLAIEEILGRSVPPLNLQGKVRSLYQIDGHKKAIPFLSKQ